MPRRTPPEPTTERLIDQALAYLARYATSRAHLRNLLLRKMRRTAPAHGLDEAEITLRITAALARVDELGLIDDARFAEDEVRKQRARGRSERQIRARLAGRGIDRHQAGDALAKAAGDDLGAAIAYARRRRLGPFRDSHTRPGERLRDLARLQRQGFSVGVVLRVVDAEDATALEALCAERDG